MNWLLVGLGGMIGAIARYALSSWVAQLFTRALLPYGLITVNVLGCLLIGVIVALMQFKHGLRPELVLFLMVGCLGGFTTFSSFGLETFTLMKNNHAFIALADVLIQVGVGTIAVGVGFWLTMRFA